MEKFYIFQINIFLSFISNILLQIQKDLINDIIFINNTNGDIYLTQDYSGKRLVFGSTSANGEERIFYGMYHNALNKYFFENNGKFVPYLRKNIGSKEKKEISNAQITLIEKDPYFAVLLIGSDNSYIEIIKLFSDINDNEINAYEHSDLFNPNIINKGMPYIYNFEGTNNIYILSSSILHNDHLNYSIYFYETRFDINDNKSFYYNLYNNISFNNDLKGEYMSCDISIRSKFMSCFYLDINNDYKISFISMDGYSFIQNKTFIIDTPSNIIDGEYYFLKVIIGSLGVQNKYGIYAYYSGELNNIPTIRIFNIGNDFSIVNRTENFSLIYLEGYNFNNGIKYNDLCLKDITSKGMDLYFISTNDNKEYLIISYIKIYINPSKHNYFQLVIRYYNIQLKEYFKLEIFHGFKSIFFNTENFLTIAFDFCLSNENVNKKDKIGNAGLIVFSYPKINTNNIEVNFVEHAFNNNGKYINVNLTKNCEIKNNIFGFLLHNICLEEIQDFSFYDDFEISPIPGIYFLVGNYLLDYTFCYSTSYSLQIDFNNYAFNESAYDKIIIKYIYKIIFPGATEYNGNCEKINDDYGNKEDTFSFRDKDNKIELQRTLPSYLTIVLDTNLSTICNDINCDLCFKNDLDYCIVCKDDNFTIINDINLGKLKICTKLGIDDLIHGKFNNITLSNENIKEIYEELKDFLEEDYNYTNIIINTTNVKIQIAPLENQKISNELSDIDLGECEEILKKKYCKSENDSLIILKFDIKLNEEQSTYVKYEIYEPEFKSKINLNECPNVNFVINMPINFDSEIESAYEMLSKEGYNLFDENDSFYNDICTTYTNDKGTDVLLSDRRTDFYQKTINISLCQSECEFQSFDKETKKARCHCPFQDSQIENIDLSELKFNKNEMINEFQKILDNSNFRVLKCFKLIFKYKSFAKNIGSIIMLILVSLFISLILVYKFKSSQKIKLFIEAIIKIKSVNMKNNVEKKIVEKGEYSKGNKSGEKLISTLKKKKKKKRRKSKKNHTMKNSNIIANVIINMNSNNNPPRKKRKTIAIGSSKNANLNKLDNNNIDKSSNPSIYIPLTKRHKSVIFKNNHVNKILDEHNNKDIEINKNAYNENDDKEIEINKNDHNENNNKDIEIYNQIEGIEIRTHSKENTQINDNYKKEKLFNESNALSVSKIKDNRNLRHSNKIKIKEIEQEIRNLNDEEMNSLGYEEAIKLDKRTYFQYYKSLIKKKQLIIFTFFSSNDYNLLTLKISLFIVSFALFLTINGFFFNDKSMHKIYQNKGSYNLLYQIPKIFYSSVVSSIVNILLKNLSLSEKSLLEIKQEKDLELSLKKAKKVENCIKIKFLIFFIISLLLMLFFWYFISCFCAIYKNTQIILFKDTIISFALSMIYPFATNIIPGLFRIPALRAEQKDKKCLYVYSQYISFVS